MKRIKRTILFYMCINAVYWGALAVMVFFGYWPVMSIGLSLATGAGVPMMDLLVQPVFMAAAVLLVADGA